MCSHNFTNNIQTGVIALLAIYQSDIVGVQFELSSVEFHVRN